MVLVVSVIGGITGTRNVKVNDSANNRDIQTGIDETELKNEFDRIANLPYSEYKCREKSDMLFDYIHQHDPTSAVHTISIPHVCGEYSHVFVEYQGVVFDPTCSPPLYRQTWDKYNQNLKIWGFQGKTITCGYNGT